MTIGIPILGLYFVTRILRSDAAALAGHLRAGDGPLAALYAAAVASEVVDVVRPPARPRARRAQSAERSAHRASAGALRL